MIIYEPPKPAESIPTIDISDYYTGDSEKKKAIAWEIHKAARETGFFYVVGHQVPKEVVEQQFALSKEYFARPEAEKIKTYTTDSKTVRGYEPMAAQTLDEGSPPDLKEGFLCGIGTDEEGIRDADSNPWPEKPDHFQAQFMAYVGYVNALGATLTKLIALSMELPESYFDDGIASPMLYARMLHYPPQEGQINENQLGAGAHKDWGFITLLMQDDIGGLEVENAAGEWITAPPVEGAFVVNLGEMIKVLTNDLYHSNMHRVVNNRSGKSRYSFPLFYNFNFAYKVSCVPTFLPEQGEPNHAEITTGDHIVYMYQKTYGLLEQEAS